MIAPKGCNYPEGEIIDWICLGCGSSFAAHDENSECWRILKSKSELQRYDKAMKLCNKIRGWQ